ncbi:MAG: efflux RND transporter permease subunit [Verrucomicrobiales bacterium]
MVRSALKNPYAIIVMALALLVIGVTALWRMPTDLLPQFKTPAVQILTLYPGMPAEVMEKDITSRIERWTGQSNGIARQEAKSMNGVSIVRDFFTEETDPNAALSQVTSLAMSDLYYLPPGTAPPMVMPFDPTASIPLCLISVSSPTYDETKLYDVAYFDLRNRLQGISGVIAPAVYGGKLRRILAYVDPLKAQARGFSPLNIMEAIRDYNVFIPTGNAKFGDIDWQLNANGMVINVPDMNKIPLTKGGDPPVFVGDVASVEDSAQIQQNVVRINGKRQVYLPIYRQPGANTIKVVEGIRDSLGPIVERTPGVNLDIVADQTSFVREAIRDLRNEAVLGFSLAAAMVFFFLRSWRPTAIVLLALPLACLGAFIGLYFTGQTINAMTLGGLALVIGLLIDESIVVLENTERHLAMGKTPWRAALDGAGEVMRPLTIVTLTISVVFFPVVFLTGLGKFLFTPLAMTVIFAIVTSRLLATTLVPVCAAKFIKRHETHASHPSDDEGWFAYPRRLYVALLGGILKIRWLVLLGSLALLGGALLFVPKLGTELFPQSDVHQFTVRYRAKSGLRIEETEKLTQRIEATVQRIVPDRERKMVIANIGVLYDWPAAYTPNSGSQDGFLLVQLAEGHRTSSFDYAQQLREALPRDVPECEFDFDTGGLLTAALNYGLPSPINIQVEGNKLEAARAIAEKVKAFAQTVPGAVDVRIAQRIDAPQLSIDVDRVKAAQLGLTQEAVVKNIVTAFNSSVNFSPSFWIDEKNGNHYFIGAQYREKDIKDLDTLLDLPITDRGQKTAIPLRAVAKITPATAPLEINHVNITRVTDVFVNVHGRDVGSVATDIERYIDSIKNDRAQVPEGYRIEMRGEVKSMRESFSALGFGLMLAVVLVYLVMVFQFRSFVDPFIVMFAVPMGFIGVIALLFITGTALSIQSAMGSIMMVGIVVSFSVLLVDFINRLRLEAAQNGRELSLRDAVLQAASLRLRPILMTSLAALLGLAPMAWHSGPNAPLARAVVGGVAAATLLVLFVVPCLYIIVKRERCTLPLDPEEAHA